MALKKSFVNKATSNATKLGNIVQIPKYINFDLVQSYLAYLGLPKNHYSGFAIQPCWRRQCPNKKNEDGCKGHVRITTPLKAYELNRPLWRRLNRVLKPLARCTMYDVTGILNICFEFEYRSDPDLALEVALHFRQYLIDKGYAPSDLPIFLSGGGIHIIINIPEIAVIKETAKRWNTAIQKFTNERIVPLFNQAKDIVSMFSGIDLNKMKLEGIDIARLLSGPGDWRPSTHSDDAESLKCGFMRCVYQGNQLYRNPWESLKNWIEKYYHEIEKKPKESLETMYHQEGTPKDEDIDNYTKEIITLEEMRNWKYQLHKHSDETIANALRRKVIWKLNIWKVTKKLPIKENKEVDRSKLVYKMICYLCWFCKQHGFNYRKFIWTFKTIINECCGNKYTHGRHLDTVIKEYILTWEKWQKRTGKLVEIDDQDVFDERNKITENNVIQFENKFFNTMCTHTSDTKGYVKKEEIYALYKEACETNSKSALKENQFTTFLKKQGIQSTMKRINGIKTRIYVGIQLRATSKSISSIDCCIVEDVYEGNPGLKEQ